MWWNRGWWNSGWWHSGWLVPLIALTAYARADVQCPGTLDGRPYTRASVFDGPPEQEADLVPDRTAGGTDVWQLDYIFDSGRQPYLVCRYKGTDRTITFQLQRPIKTCLGPRSPHTVICR